jgi:hypothetical protein
MPAMKCSYIKVIPLCVLRVAACQQSKHTGDQTASECNVTSNDKCSPKQLLIFVLLRGVST